MLENASLLQDCTDAHAITAHKPKRIGGFSYKRKTKTVEFLCVSAVVFINAFPVRVTVRDSGRCCCTYVTYFER